MMPLPNRWLTACYTKFNGSGLLIDCGEGTQIAMRQAGLSFHDIDVIAITHFHGDHISGITGLLLSMGNSDRVDPVTVIGPAGIKKVVDCLRIIAPELPFDLEFVEIGGREGSLDINGYTLEYYRLNHNVTCYGYSQVIRRAGRFDPEKAAKNKVPMAVWSRLQKNETAELDGVVYTRDMILGPERKGLRLTYCTDTRPVPIIAEHAKDADLFICEGMYGEEDMEKKAAKHKHMTFYEAAEIAKAAGARELWLTHFSPSLVRPIDYLDNARKIFDRTYIPKDGWKKTLMFEDMT